MKIEEIHFNIPQLRSMTIFAPEEWAVLARGTGKTKGIIAPKSERLLHMMPRCTGVIVGATFQQILTRTLPPVIAGWEKLGYINGKHFHIGVKPPKTWREKFDWRGPYHLPLNFEYFISWWNGAGIQLVSQDRAGSSNGVSIDWIMGDEAKLLNRERLTEELFPANRGVYRELANNPHHHGKTFTTDMPKGTAGRWILEKENEMDFEKVKAIISLECLKYEYSQKLQGKTTKPFQAKALKYIAEIETAQEVLRKNLVYFHEASALSNIHTLGVDYIKMLMRDLSDFEFKTAILNQRPYKIEDGFYPDLDEDRHGYFSYDYSHTFNAHGYNLELINSINDCRRDGDMAAAEPLHISMDYNRRIWPIVTAQVQKHSGCDELRILSGLDELYPKGLSDALQLWNDYYKPHKHKNNDVIFWHDHTAYGETRTPLATEIVEKLEKLGWNVTKKYIGKQPLQSTRYEKIADILKENGKYAWQVRMNRDNCKYIFLSMYQAEAVEKGKDYGKDKKTERDKSFPARESTHYSDAFDTLVYGMIVLGIDYAIGGSINSIEVR